MATFLVLVFMLLDHPPACPKGMVLAQGVCMDQYEAPNRKGRNPLVMQSAYDGEKWCQAHGKRLCTEDEWDRVCESAGEPCHNGKRWLPWDEDAFLRSADPEVTAKEVKRLWQNQPSGSSQACRSPEGVYDLKGSVEEWVVAREGRDYSHTLKGGFWSKKTSCSGSNDAHHPSFKFYETGYRCCLTPRRVSVPWGGEAEQSEAGAP